MVFEKKPPITSLLTLPETNIAPEDGPSQKGNNRLPIIHFQVTFAVSFREGTNIAKNRVGDVNHQNGPILWLRH